ncbi:hypothetical protein PRIC1_009981 [Phytophthora ramorum]
MQLSVLSRQVHRASGAALSAMLVQPLHDWQVAAASSVVHGLGGASFAAVLAQPLHDREVAVLGGVVHRARGTAAQLLRVVQPREDVEVAVAGCEVHDERVTRVLRLLGCRQRQVLHQELHPLRRRALQRPRTGVVEVLVHGRPHVRQLTHAVEVVAHKFCRRQHHGGSVASSVGGENCRGD